MNEDRILISPISEIKGGNADFNFRETLSRYLFHWPLFLLVMLVALGMAFLYVRYSEPLYDIRAKLLIKDDRKEQPQAGNDLKRMDVFGSSKIIENEVEILRSRKLIQRVVNELQLWTRYEKVGRVHNQDYYDKTPVKFTLLEPAGNPVKESFDVIIKSPETFMLIGKDGATKEFSYSDRLRNKLGLWRLDTTAAVKDCIGYVIRVTIQDPELVADQYVGRLKTEKVNKEASVIEISIEDQVLLRGKEVLNRLVTAYNDATAEEKRKIAEKALHFIDERLAALSGELNNVEKDFEGFRSSRGITDVSSEAKLYLENVRSNDIQMNDVDVKLKVISDIERFVNTNKAGSSAPATLGISDPVLISNINRVMDLQMQKDKLLATVPEGNPMFDPLNKQINTAKAAIRGNIASLKSSLQSAKHQLNSNNSRFESSIRNIPGQEREFVSIKRQQSVKENLYIYLLQKREEAALSYAQTLTASETVDYAYDQNEKKKLTFTIAFLLGLIIPAGVVYGRGLINNSVTTSRELEETSVPVLSELMFMDTEDVVVVKESERSILAEQFRAMRTNLLFLHERKESGRVTLVTSSIPAEGKSFVAVNLGTALASSGRKTIILELDFRKPKISAYLGLKEDKGLSEYLTGKASRSEVIQRAGVDPDLYIMATGALPANPTKLLDQKRMDELIAWLRTEYDDIIIDTPPVYLVTDAMILARLSDVSLYVVRQGVTLKEHLQYIKQLNKQAKFRKLNLVFNGIQMDGKYGYGYSYDYGYYVKPSGNRKNKYRTAVRNIISRF